MHASPLIATIPRRVIALLAAFALALPAAAHLGSPDTFVQRNAGPYPLLIALHPPSTFPGALELDLRSNPGDHLTSATAAFDANAPTSIQLFADGTAVATLWIASPSAHTLHIAVQGSRGPAILDIDLPATAAPTRPIHHRWTLILAAIVLFAASIVILRRNRTHPRSTHSLRGLVTLTLLLASCAILFIAFLLPATPPTRTAINATLLPTGQLDFTLTNPAESFANLVPDHGKLLHLFLIRQPRQDVFLHLHPHQVAPGHFTVQLPAMPPGTYQLFADFYHSDSTGETATLALTLPPQFHTSSAADPDDSTAVLPPLPPGAPHLAAEMWAGTTPPASSGQTAHLPDGYTLQLHTDAALEPLRAHILQVTLLDPSGRPPVHMEPYLGMTAHAVVLATKVTSPSDAAFIFAHIHPGGTLPMLSTSAQIGTNMPAMDPNMPMPAISNTAAIPYGFPIPADYRLFVQMKHGHIVETAAFDLHVGNR